MWIFNCISLAKLWATRFSDYTNSHVISLTNSGTRVGDPSRARLLPIPVHLPDLRSGNAVGARKVDCNRECMGFCTLRSDYFGEKRAVFLFVIECNTSSSWKQINKVGYYVISFFLASAFWDANLRKALITETGALAALTILSDVIWIQYTQMWTETESLRDSLLVLLLSQAPWIISGYRTWWKWLLEWCYTLTF